MSKTFLIIVYTLLANSFIASISAIVVGIPKLDEQSKIEQQKQTSQQQENFNQIVNGNISNKQLLPDTQIITFFNSATSIQGTSTQSVVLWKNISHMTALDVLKINFKVSYQKRVT